MAKAELFLYPFIGGVSCYAKNYVRDWELGKDAYEYELRVKELGTAVIGSEYNGRIHQRLKVGRVELCKRNFFITILYLLL